MALADPLELLVVVRLPWLWALRPYEVFGLEARDDESMNCGEAIAVSKFDVSGDGRKRSADR